MIFFIWANLDSTIIQPLIFQCFSHGLVLVPHVFPAASQAIYLTWDLINIRVIVSDHLGNVARGNFRQAVGQAWLLHNRDNSIYSACYFGHLLCDRNPIVYQAVFRTWGVLRGRKQQGKIQKLKYMSGIFFALQSWNGSPISWWSQVGVAKALAPRAPKN